MDKNFLTTELNMQDLKEALNLVWNVFLEFEAPDYCQEGILEFKEFIRYDAIKDRLLQSQFKMWICRDNKKIVGVLAGRLPCHISLLFVDKQYHRKGIARDMLNHAIEYYRLNSDCIEITVNSSPYARAAYNKLGFKEMDGEQTVNDIRFIPMKYPL